MKHIKLKEILIEKNACIKITETERNTSRLRYEKLKSPFIAA